MGNLPQGCIKPARSFLKTDIDYASSILMRTSWGRGHRSQGIYSHLCMPLFALRGHFRLFYGCIPHRISSKGLCSDVHSDCGTNFTDIDK